MKVRFLVQEFFVGLHRQCEGLLHGVMAPRLLKMLKKVWKGARGVKRSSAKKRASTTSYERLHVWDKGAIWALHMVKTPREKIAEIVSKVDGTAPAMGAIDRVIATKKANPEWRGEREHSKGKPKILTEAQ